MWNEEYCLIVDCVFSKAEFTFIWTTFTLGFLAIAAKLALVGTVL
jgi:hypothetical protein